MRIAVDMDEVLTRWVERILQWYNEDKAEEAYQKGEEWVPLDVSAVTSWNIAMNMGPDSEIYLRNYMRWPFFFYELDPVPGAVEGMEKLISEGHDVLVVTHVPRSAGMGYEGKKEWLRKHMPFFNLDNLIVARRKDLVMAHLLVDDGIHNLDPWTKSGRDAIAFDRPWNKSSIAPFRAYTWQDVTDIVRELTWNEAVGVMRSMKGTTGG